MQLYDWVWPVQVCHGKINIIEGLTLLSLSRPGSMCVLLDSVLYTNTTAGMQRAHIGEHNACTLRLWTQYANTDAHKEHIKVEYACSSREIHMYTLSLRQSISAAQHTIPPPTPCASVMPVCLCAHLCVCQASHRMLEGPQSWHRYLDRCLFPSAHWLTRD